jgi:hypothetical protein
MRCDDDTFTARMPDGRRVTLRVKRDIEKLNDLDPLELLVADGGVARWLARFKVMTGHHLSLGNIENGVRQRLGEPPIPEAVDAPTPRAPAMQRPDAQDRREAASAAREFLSGGA